MCYLGTSGMESHNVLCQLLFVLHLALGEVVFHVHLGCLNEGMTWFRDVNSDGQLNFILSLIKLSHIYVASIFDR